MSKKIIYYLSIVIIVVINIAIDFNINNYIEILQKCFIKEMMLNEFYYTLICVITAFISILSIVAMRLVIFARKEEIKGIQLKVEDGTYGTANWLSDSEVDKILGKNEIPGIILGKRNNDIIKLPFDSFFNKNIAVFGSSGSMKTIRIFSY